MFDANRFAFAIGGSSGERAGLQFQTNFAKVHGQFLLVIEMRRQEEKKAARKCSEHGEYFQGNAQTVKELGKLVLCFHYASINDNLYRFAIFIYCLSISPGLDHAPSEAIAVAQLSLQMPPQLTDHGRLPAGSGKAKDLTGRP